MVRGVQQYTCMLCKINTVDLEIFVYENFQGKLFHVKHFHGSVVPTKIILHEIFFTRKHARRSYCVGDYHASFVSFKKQLLVLVCENEPWSVVKSGCKQNGGPTALNDDRSSTTHLLVDLARTSAGCDCVIRSPLLHAVGNRP